MAVLVVRGITYVAEDDAIVSRIAPPIAYLTLCSEETLRRSPSLDRRCWLR